MVKSRRVLGIGFLVIFISVHGVDSRALPQDTVTQSGEPSHFQVDDKSAEIEVNANPAGVKVNAKPASLQVVAKPGTPAIPVYHPAIHIAPHYLPPPIVHREPARYFLHRHHCYPCCPPMCSGMSRGWFYSGLRRNDLPKPDTTMQKSESRDITGEKSSEISKKPDRDSLGRELDKDGNVISRKHKSSIPRPEKGHKEKDSNKRQFIAGIPQQYMPQGIMPQQYMPQGIMGLGASGYTMANTRAPLARNLISPYNGGQSLYSPGQSLYSPYSASGLNSLYGQPLTNSPMGLGTLSGYGQLSSSSPRMYSGYGPIQPQYNSPTSNSPGYSLGPSTNAKSNIINSFLQSEINHELYRSTATPSPFGLDQGYSRSIINTPYNGLLSGRGNGGAMGIGGMGSLYGGPLASLGMGYQGGYGYGGYGNYGNSPIMQLAQLYAAMSPGLQQSRAAMPLQSYPNMVGRSPLVSRSKVPGSRKKVSKYRHKINSGKSKLRRKRHIVRNRKGRSKDEKSRNKRQLLDQDLGGYNIDDVLQDALVNEFKREMILGSQQSPLTAQQSSLGLPFPGLPPVYDANQQQTANLMGLSQMATLDANYVAPLQRLNSGNLGNSLAQSQALSSAALGRSQVSPDQIRLMPSMEERASRLSMGSSVPLQRQLPQQQGFVQNGPNELVGPPMAFKADFRSPIQYEDERRHHYRRNYERHPLFRRRLHRNYYDDDYRDDYNDDDYHDNREMYRGEHLGRGTVSMGPYSENEYPGNEGETLVDTSNHGFGTITVEAKTAEGVRKSLGEDRRGKIAIPEEARRSPREERRGRIASLKEDRASLGEEGRISTLQGERKPVGEDRRGEIARVEKRKSLGEEGRGRISTLEEERKSVREERRGEIATVEERKPTGEGKRGGIAILQEEQKTLGEGRRGEITNHDSQETEKFVEKNRRGEIAIPQQEQKEQRNENKKQIIPFRSGVL